MARHSPAEQGGPAEPSCAAPAVQGSGRAGRDAQGRPARAPGPLVSGWGGTTR